jgi:hypothetical protein
VQTTFFIKEVLYGSQPPREQMPNWHVNIMENQGKASTITLIPTAN